MKWWLWLLLGLVGGIAFCLVGGVLVFKIYAGDVLGWLRHRFTILRPGLAGGPGTPAGAESIT